MKASTERSEFRILIVGAGPAGTSAAIRLAGKGYEVTLLERETFPRHKLCGEFVSPECFDHFRELGVLNGMISAGGDRITETVFYAPGGQSVTVPSKWFNRRETAIGLSRSEMDHQLLERAKKIGVSVAEGTQVVGLLIENKRVCGVRTKAGAILADLIIDATGRSRVLCKLVDKGIQDPKPKTQNTLVGFKTHLQNVKMVSGRCEIYFFEGGYGGLNYVEDGIANHCFLIKAQTVKDFGGNVENILKNVVFKNERSRETLENAVPVFDWLAVAVDGFGVRNLAPAPNLLAIGDAGAFIDPFTGSGMLMAMESAEMMVRALEPDLSFEEIAERYKRMHHVKFRQRLRICNLMRRAAFRPSLVKSVISVLSLVEKPTELLARATRSNLRGSEK